MRLAILGAGFIGANLITAAVNKGYFVSVLSRHPCPEKYKVEQIDWVVGDFNNKSDVSQSIKNADVVYHLISNSVPGDKVAIEDDLFENVSNTIQLLECCHLEGIRRIIFLSSSSVYGEQTETPIKESAILSPISTHAIQKITIEYYLKYYKRLYNFDIKIIRLSNPYGPGQDIHGRQGFISIVLGNIIDNKATLINGSGDVVRDFIYIEDVILVLLKMINIKSDDVIFNLGSGEGVRLLDVISIISKVLNQEVKYEIANEHDAGISKSILNIDKIKSFVGTPSTISLYDGVNKYVSYLKLIEN